MVGAIRKRNILAHPIVTIQCFGWRVFLKAILAPPGTTFLSLVAPAEPVKPTKKLWREPIERCCNLELRAKQIYVDMAERFGEVPGSLRVLHGPGQPGTGTLRSASTLLGGDATGTLAFGGFRTVVQ